ncbi:MAG: hypothetical protein IH840_04765 [Candidatus Heimdallarchaeota archaeon]|nr:hypothetical protein [Candidatus Heimdallarchaeota archaeon]
MAKFSNGLLLMLIATLTSIPSSSQTSLHQLEYEEYKSNFESIYSLPV